MIKVNELIFSVGNGGRGNAGEGTRGIGGGGVRDVGVGRGSAWCGLPYRF